MTEPRAAKWIGVIAMFGFLGVVFVGFFFGIFGYFDYLHDSHREEACVSQFGEGSDWVANGWSDDGMDQIICETPDGDLERIEHTGLKPIGFGTYVEYLGHLSSELR